MAYYGPAGRGGGGWYYGGGGASYMYGPGSGLVGAGWTQGRGVGEAATSMQEYRGWVVGEQLRELGAKRAPPLAMIRPETMRAAEAAANEVLLRLHPTEEDEKRRQEIIHYAKQLIGMSFGCEVFAFGSVPLKTYLPDGDIDLTVLTNKLLDIAFIDDVRRLLKTEQQNTDSRFAVKRMKFINAEVKLIKCFIGNTTVDISFNQIGGVSTLCFLELVDSEVGKDHLFKRSIMLVKVWCYNESHILGAHHWLLSTYALEILVLHIFNVFHKSLHSPLEALYKFLEYYSKFDWDKYALTLDGPVPLSSLRNFSAEPTAIYDDLLVSKESLKFSLDRLLLLPRDFDRCNAKFRLKHLNILDPLKGNNNLGRSVNKENFYRIRSAFSFGAQKLGLILLLPSELIPGGIYDFFGKTLKRYGGGENLIPNNSLELSDKELEVKAKTHKTSGRYFPYDGRDCTWNKIWLRNPLADYYKMVLRASISAKPSYLTNSIVHSSFSPENGNDSIKQCRYNCATWEDLSLGRLAMQQHHILTSSSRTNTLGVSSSCLDNKSNCTDAHQEKMLLPSFAPPNLLDLSGDLYLHLGYLRHVQYNFEALFDDFMKIVQKAYLAGLLNEDCFKTITYMPDNTVPLSPRIVEAVAVDWVDLAVSPSPTADLENHHDSWLYMIGDIPKTRGIGTYIPQMNFGFYRDRMTRMYRKRQPGRVHPSSQHTAGESARSQTPTTQNSSQQHAPKEAHHVPFMARAPRGCGTKQIPAGQTWKALNSQQRAENGTPPRSTLPHHGGNAAQGNHLTVPTTADSQSSSPVVAEKGFKPLQEETREFGTLGRFSPTQLTPKFIEDFPPLPASKSPPASTLKGSWPVEALASTVQSPKSGATSAQGRPGEALTLTVQSPKPDAIAAQTRPLEALASSPRPGASVSQSRPKELYQLKDDADFPPLQARTR